MLPQVRMRLGQKNKRIYFVCRSTFTNFAPYMLNFISFGSGSSGNCYYLYNEEADEAILIDAGVGIRRLKRFVKEYEVNMKAVKGVIITHDHADHIKAISNIMSELNVFAYTTENIHRGMNANYTVKHIDTASAINIEKGTEFTIGSFHITAFPIPHDSTENVGYEIRCGEKNFTIMTDVGMPTETIKEHIRRANYLVLEANYDEEMLKNGPYPKTLKERITSGSGHLSNNQTASLLLENLHPDLSHVWLCHLSEENNHPELARKTIEYTLRTFGIIAGKDFQLEVLRRQLPTGPWKLDV